MRPLLWLDCQTLLTAPSRAGVITRLPWGCWFPSLPRNHLIWSTTPHVVPSVTSLPTLPSVTLNKTRIWTHKLKLKHHPRRGGITEEALVPASTALSQHAAYGSGLSRCIIFLKIKRRVNSRAGHVRVHSHCTATVKISLKEIARSGQSRVPSRSLPGISAYLPSTMCPYWKTARSTCHPYL